ncbi:hypothetical protein [Streptomyces lasiicapitis]|uniref:Uncharacterized protein n=1 Tax=Streptomyces lasiicapitis TaxID=1923961 RepID=A0ABQ2M6P8_9ACTN|nr:hypothetical protein [Streptomyces lasiicapitis]GGO47527.1 hypothetical protein GCM10012286_41030 [Streptomyces lasiicapitis]
MSVIAKLSERHVVKLAWLAVLGGAASAVLGDRLWRWAAGLGPGVGFAFGAFCGTGILCGWALAAAALRRRQWVRCAAATAVGTIAFLALAGLFPGRNGRLVGSLVMPRGQRMWVEENPTVWWAIAAGLALGALALWRTISRRPAR